MAQIGANQPKQESATTGNKTTGFMREIITGIIAFLILGVTLWMLWDTYQVGRDSLGGLDDAAASAASEAYSRQLELLTIAVGFFGAVIGYYFGRVPAEARADSAQTTANAAVSSEANVKAEVRSVLPVIGEGLSMRVNRAAVAPDSNDGSEIQMQQAQNAVQRLHELVG